MWIKVVDQGFPLLNIKLFTFVSSVLNFVFLTTSLSTALLNYFKSTGKVFNFSTSNAFTLAFKLFKLFGTLVILLMSSLWNSAFKAIKSFWATKSDVSMPVGCFNSF